MQKAIGYIRVSTQGQADAGVSLEAQQAKICAWCELNDAELVAVFEDAGLSGSKMVTGAVMAEVTAWQSRPLEPMYPVVFFDALQVKIREETVVRNSETVPG